MDFVPLSTGTASDMDDLVENIEALADGSGFDDGAIGSNPAAIDADAIGTGPYEIRRVTLGSAGDLISLTSIPARKYLRVIINTPNSGQTRHVIRFNNDSGSNYSYRTSTNGGADSTSGTQSAIIISPSSSDPKYTVMDIINVSTEEKKIMSRNWSGSTGASGVPARVEGYGKWANTSTQITRIDIINDGTGDFAIGSEAVVIAHN